MNSSFNWRFSKSKTPTLNGLIGTYKLSDDIRKRCHIPTNILTGEVSRWKTVAFMIADYFSAPARPSESASRAFSEFTSSLQRIKEIDVTRKYHVALKQFAAKVYTFLQDEDNMAEFEETYHHKYLERSVRITKRDAVLQGRVAGNKLAERGARDLAMEESAGETSMDEGFAGENLADDDSSEESPSISQNLFDDNNEPKEHITIVKGSTIFKLQTPSKNIVSPNKPALQRDDIEQLTEVADICVDIESRRRCSVELAKLSEDIISCRQKYQSLKHLGLFQYALDLLKIDNQSEFDKRSSEVTLPNSQSPCMLGFIKKILSEFAINCNRPAPYNNDDERSIYIEVFVPLFKCFALMTQKIVFSWSERAMLHTSSVRINDSNYKKSGVNRKLLDGIGVLISEDISWLLIESSGYFKDQNYTHTIEDTIKNLKNSIDSLKYIMSKYKHASLNTFKRVKIFSIQIIQTKMTLVCYQLCSSQKWKAYECCSTDVPLFWSKRKYYVAILEMFSYLYCQLLEQEEVYQTLGDEALGIINRDDIKVSTLYETRL